MSFYDYPAYVSVSDKKANNLLAISKLRKKNSELAPVIIEGALGKTWWGKAWNKNLEKYADYSNRINRGKSYVKQHCVLDLKITKGHIQAKVQGSRKKPYDVQVEIETLEGAMTAQITASAQKSIESIEDLIKGKFPKTLETLICDEKEGLFPSPKAISFACSCPDYASMCKHIAAVLYGIGARLDENPLMFFELRDLDVHHLIKKSLEERMETMFKHLSKPSEREISDDEIEDLFGL